MSTIVRAAGSGGGSPSAVVSAVAVSAAVSASNTAAQNSTAIQAAVTAAAAAGFGRVSLPGGQFDHQGITLPNTGAVTIQGAGRGRTILRNTHATNASLTAAGSTGGPYCPVWQLSDLTLTTDATTTVRAGQYGLLASLASRFSVSNVEIQYHDVGVRHLSSWDCSYDSVNVARCGIGWQFPTNAFTPSCPVRINHGSAWNCTTRAVHIEDQVEGLTWVGGDFAGSADGVLIDGNNTRAVRFTGVNFERITGTDVTVGSATLGPADISFSNCRFLRTTTGIRAVQYVRGSALSFYSCFFSNYTTAVRHEAAAGTLIMVGNNPNAVTNFYDSNGAISSNAPVLFGSPNNAARLDGAGPSSVARQLYAFDGIGTKALAGAGKTTVTDADFLNTPQNNLVAIVRNTSDDTARLAVRANGTWRYINLT